MRSLIMVIVTATLSCKVSATPGPPLFLTPLIEQGLINEAQNRSLVTTFDQDLESYAGYLTVDKTYNSNMFFWFIPAETTPADAPLLLWLNGGPGVPSMTGALLENGPLAFTDTKTGKLERRNDSWTKYFSMLYIDNPVGAGYSYTLHEDGISGSVEDIALNLYRALVQFLKMFPNFSGNDFYVGGQSYAGKYVPTLGRYIHDCNHERPDPPEVLINLKGIYLGGAMCDPHTMMPVFPDTLFFDGFISDIDRQTYKAKLVEIMQRGLAAQKLDIMDIYTTLHSDEIHNAMTCIADTDNLLGCMHTNYPLVERLEGHFLRTDTYREAFHVGPDISDPYKAAGLVYNFLPRDFVRNTTDENAFLMEHYKVLHYTGNLDVIVSVAMTEAFLLSVPWSGQEAYRTGSRQRWFVNDTLAGWFIEIGNFTRVVVRNAGHMTPYDQPTNTLQMMKSFVLEEPFVVESRNVYAIV